MKNDVLQLGTHASGWQRLEQAEVGKPERQNLAAGWSIALLVSIGLWTGIWWAVSSLAGALM